MEEDGIGIRQLSGRAMRPLYGGTQPGERHRYTVGVYTTLRERSHTWLALAHPCL